MSLHRKDIEMTWEAHLSTNDPNMFMRNMLAFTLYNHYLDGSYEYPYLRDGDDPNTWQTYRTIPGVTTDPEAPQPRQFFMPIEAAEAVMENLQKHFGAYAGVDYDRLRTDYDRVVAELKEANEHNRAITNQLLERRVSMPRRPSGPQTD